MANKLDCMDLRQLITLHLDKVSNRRIGITLGINRNTVNGYMHQFVASDIPLKELLELDDASLTELFPAKTSINNARYDQLMQYFEKVNESRSHPGFTFLYHYYEYKSQSKQPYSYTQFMEHYNRKHTKVRGSMKLEHKAGDEMMIDFAGKRLHITDRQTGELIPVEVFVAILPSSQYSYIQACPSQKREDLLACIANALSFFNGVPKAIVSDNLKSAVTRASKYEPQINKSLKDFARHYRCVVNPTRTYSPQDKALVENAVHLGYQRIYYPMRDMTFFSLIDLNKEIKKLLGIYNDLLFQRKEASRKELFQSIERAYLKPLPQTSYEIKDYRRAKVQKIGYVYFSPDKHYYSVPHRYIGQDAMIHYTKNTVEVYRNNERIAIHQRNPSKGVYSTIKEHLSSAHQAYKDWSPEYFKSLAGKHGPAVLMFVSGLLHQEDYPEVAYKRCIGIIQLAKGYGSSRLNNACERACYGNTFSYRMVKNILENNLDKEQFSQKQLNQNTPHIPKHANIRGKFTYQ